MEIRKTEKTQRRTRTAERRNSVRRCSFVHSVCCTDAVTHRQGEDIGNSNRPLRPMREDGRQPPAFLIHPRRPQSHARTANDDLRDVAVNILIVAVFRQAFPCIFIIPNVIWKPEWRTENKQETRVPKYIINARTGLSGNMRIVDEHTTKATIVFGSKKFYVSYL